MALGGAARGWSRSRDTAAENSRCTRCSVTACASARVTARVTFTPAIRRSASATAARAIRPLPAIHPRVERHRGHGEHDDQIHVALRSGGRQLAPAARHRRQHGEDRAGQEQDVCDCLAAEPPAPGEPEPDQQSHRDDGPEHQDAHELSVPRAEHDRDEERSAREEADPMHPERRRRSARLQQVPDQVDGRGRGEDRDAAGESAADPAQDAGTGEHGQRRPREGQRQHGEDPRYDGPTPGESGSVHEQHSDKCDRDRSHEPHLEGPEHVLGGASQNDRDGREAGRQPGRHAGSPTEAPDQMDDSEVCDDRESEVRKVAVQPDRRPEQLEEQRRRRAPVPLVARPPVDRGMQQGPVVVGEPLIPPDHEQGDGARNERRQMDPDRGQSRPHAPCRTLDHRD